MYVHIRGLGFKFVDFLCKKNRYHLKVHSFTYRIRYKTLFCSKWYTHNNELNTMAFHQPGLVVETTVLSALKRMAWNKITSHTFTFLQDFLRGFLNYSCGNNAIIRYSSYTYLSMRIMHISVLNQEFWPYLLKTNCRRVHFSLLKFKYVHLTYQMPFKYHCTICSSTVQHTPITFNVSVGILANQIIL